MNVTLQLRYCETAQRPAAAWLVPGDGAQMWLAELTAWQVPLAEAKLFPLPGIGVLALLPIGSPAPQVVTAIAYGRLAQWLFAPVEGALDPPLTERELTSLLPDGWATYVWHPGAGLLRFAAESELTVADLLTALPESETRWDTAEPGLALNQRLVSLEPLAPLTLNDVLAAGRGDIGTQPLRGSHLPAAPHEPAGGALGAAIAQAGMSAAAFGAQAISAAAGALGSVGGALGSMLGGMLGGAGGTGSSPPRRPVSGSAAPRQGSSWFDRLKAWAKQRREAARQNLDQLRNRQIERLLNMLNQAPDDGLRFALPMGTGEHRGLAPPSARLGEHRVDFNLSNLGGGGPADFWDLPNELRQRLQQRYRELANREIALGRHRRAAYIFAELLGDLPSAATTLADGGHHREAAVLFKERLKQPLRAAECLQKGGLWTEAIALYEELKQWETVGDLYRRLDREDQARNAYLRVVAGQIEGHDFLGAAKLLEGKLADAAEAYEVLLQGWGKAQPACLDAAFELLARGGEHGPARELVTRLAPGEVPDRGETVSNCLAKAAGSYPDDEVRRLAADASRGHIAALLPMAAADQRTRLLRTLTSLVPADRLLERDTFRYAAQQSVRERLARKPLALPKRTADKVRLVEEIKLPAALWKTAISTPGLLLAAGVQAGELVVVQANFKTGACQPTKSGWCPLTVAEQQLPILLAARQHRPDELLVHVRGSVPAKSTELPAGYPYSLIAPPPTSANLIGLQFDEADSLLNATVHQPGIVAVSIFAVLNKALIGSPAISHGGILPEAEPPHPFFSRRGTLYLGVGNVLISRKQTQEATTLHAPITAITGSHAAAAPRIVAACEQGAVVVWGESARSPESAFAMDLLKPVVGLSRGGVLVAATSETIEIHRTDNDRLAYLATLSGPGSRPIAVLPTDAPSRFALVTETGRVLMYEATA